MTADDLGPVHAGHMDCSQALDRLFAYLDSELDPAAVAEMRQHLAECEPCFAEYGVEERVKFILRRSCAEKAPVELHMRIREQLVVLRTELRG